MKWGTFTGGLLIGVLGVAILCLVDWRIAVGVFLLMWGDNVSRRT